MQQYKNLLRDIMTNGRRRGDRTGTGTLSVFGRQLTFDLQDGFPLVTLKRTPMRPLVAELVWFLEGSGDNKRLRQLTGLAEGQRGIWDQWAITKEIAAQHPIKTTFSDIYNHDLEGDLGPIYGVQWRHWVESVSHMSVNREAARVGYVRCDQMQTLIDGLKNNPYSRRHIVSAWRPTELPDESKSPQQNVLDGKMALAPCHAFFQCYVRDMTLEERLDHYNTHMASIGMRLGMDASTDHAATHELLDKLGVRSRYLDLHMYQRKLNCALTA